MKILDNILKLKFSTKYKNFGWLLFIHEIKYFLRFFTGVFYSAKGRLFVKNYLTLCYFLHILVAVICIFLVLELLATNSIYYKFLRNNDITSFKSDKNITIKRHMFTTTKNVLAFCQNCAGVAVVASVTPEVLYKSAYRPNAMSP